MTKQVKDDADKSPCNRMALRAIPKAMAMAPVRLILALLSVYQYVLSPLKYFFFGASCGCRFQPTCSHYAREAFTHFGFFKGLWFTVRRLLRCHPWHPGGFDPLPGVNDSCDQAAGGYLK